MTGSRPAPGEVRTYRLEIDDGDLIRAVSDSWIDFATENGEDRLSSPSVVGHPLWEFIVDAETRYLYREIFSAVRKRGEAISVPFRCDAPDQRRFMRITIAPLDQGGLELASELIRVEARPSVPLLERGVRRTSEVLSMCGWCKKVMLADEWVEVEVAVEALDLFAGAGVPNLSHEICPPCREGLSHLIH